MNKERNISIIGGAGHVGFPLGLIFSSKGFHVNLIDKNLTNIRKINKGKIPFLEENSQNLLKKMIRKKRIFATTDLSKVSESKYIIICIGTPISNNLNPKLKGFVNFFYDLNKFLKSEQIVIIRSSIYPGIYNKIYKIINKKCKNLSYCPERIVQGKSLIEMPKLPQLISVLKGDMSFVGPRPALFNQNDLIKLRTHNEIHKLKPGITGWAQVNGRDELSIPEKVNFEIEYMRKENLILDLYILWLTLLKVFKKEDISH